MFSVISVAVMFRPFEDVFDVVEDIGGDLGLSGHIGGVDHLFVCFFQFCFCVCEFGDVFDDADKTQLRVVVVVHHRKGEEDGDFAALFRKAGGFDVFDEPALVEFLPGLRIGV